MGRVDDLTDGLVGLCLTIAYNTQHIYYCSKDVCYDYSHSNPKSRYSNSLFAKVSVGGVEVHEAH